MQSTSLRVEVGGLTPYGSSVISGGVVVCSAARLAACGANCWSCLHGATCDHRYFHAEFARHQGYSFAEYFTALGYHVLTIDHPGMGSSTRPEPERLLTRDIVAAVNDHVTRDVALGLAAGRWFEVLADERLRITGLAHSLGGMLGIVQQARHRTFARLAVMGWSNIGVRFEGANAAGMARGGCARGLFTRAARVHPRALSCGGCTCRSDRGG